MRSPILKPCLFGLVFGLAASCSSKTQDAGEGSGGADGSGIDTRGSATDGGSGSPATGGGSAATAGSADSGVETSAADGTAGDATAGESSGGNDPGTPLDCGGTIYACGDGMDNDDDGLSDLNDPECTGPCDNDESSFQTGLPGDNMDCKQDCFFDGNSGQGDDGCIWDLRCDPANPGANVNCEYRDGSNCGNVPPNQDPACVSFCTQYVPPGCDCFGCCTVQTEAGPVDIFLNSGPDCSLDNLEGCQPCTSQISDCGTPCVPGECQICFGESEPPPECGGAHECPDGETCTDHVDCPGDYYCQLGCCYPPPAG